MITLTSAAVHRIKTDIMIIPVWESPVGHWNPRIADWIRQAVALSEFTAKPGDTQVRFDLEGDRTPRVAFFGLGKPDASPVENLRRVAGQGVKEGIERRLSDMVIVMPDMEPVGISETSVVEAIAEGAVLANSVSDRYKTAEDGPAPVSSIRILIGSKTLSAHKPIVARVRNICTATLHARDWVNTPSNHKRPKSLADSICRAASGSDLKTSILTREQLRRQKMGALLAVGAGSDSQPVLVTMEHRPKKKTAKTVALIGKGITFDTGGYNIKPTGSMESMKVDMAGAAAVAATMMAAPALKLNVRLVGVLPIAENMVSGQAYRPGDVVNTHSGKTVEIGNTDAEGRLILADAISFAIKRFSPDLIIDLATLTGACVVALGESIAGVFSPDERLTEAIRKAGEAVNEPCWPMPMPDEYREMLKSEIADLRNIGSTRWGGAILAALFLSEFVGTTRWAHIDIAGPASAKKASAYCESGATGFGVRLLCRLLKDIGDEV
jgi:leucyl aminopeptidase